jgi:hypothetical protein
MPRSVIVIGSPEQQRPDERVAYQVTLDASYASPSAPACTLYDITDAAAVVDVSATKLSGSAALVGQVFTSPLVIALVATKKYRLEFQFVSGGNTFEPYLIIKGVV